MFRSKRSKELLNEMKWKGYDLEDCEIYYIHRGAPDDTMIIKGDDIESIERSFLVLKEGSSIPYHRVFRITYRGQVVYEKR